MKKIIIVNLIILFLSSCSTTYVGSSSLGDKFPTVSAKRLSGEVIAIPDVFLGKPHLVIVGYVMNAQFDIDRWLIALNQAQIDIPVTELPTISGMVPGLISSKIDSGMKQGIPSSDWVSVATIYHDSKKVIDFLGNEKPNNAHLVLIDSQSNVIWKHHDGFSVGTLNILSEKIKSLKN